MVDQINMTENYGDTAGNCSIGNIGIGKACIDIQTTAKCGRHLAVHGIRRTYRVKGRTRFPSGLIRGSRLQAAIGSSNIDNANAISIRVYDINIPDGVGEGIRYTIVSRNRVFRRHCASICVATAKGASILQTQNVPTVDGIVGDEAVKIEPAGLLSRVTIDEAARTRIVEAMAVIH